MKKYRLILWILIAAMVICIAALVVVISTGRAQTITKISTEAELLEILGKSDSKTVVNAVLTEDITLNTIFEPGNLYGSFDGRGHTVTIGNNQIEKLFDVVHDRAKVLNLNVKGTFGYSGSLVAAGICEYNRGTIENCCVLANFNVSIDSAGICRTNAGSIFNCAVFGKSFPTGDRRLTRNPITEKNTGTVENCFYLKEDGEKLTSDEGTGLSLGECTDGTLMLKLENYSRGHNGLVSWKNGADGFPILSPDTTSKTASVFANGSGTFWFLCIIAVMTVLMIYIVYFFDKRQKYVKEKKEGK